MKGIQRVYIYLTKTDSYELLVAIHEGLISGY